jgi:hypothetical protein
LSSVREVKEPRVEGSEVKSLLPERESNFNRLKLPSQSGEAPIKELELRIKLVREVSDPK